MEQRARAVLALAAMAAALVAGVASVAWACVPSSHFWAEKDYGPAGSAARLQGTGFTAGQAVEIRWGSAEGLLLATAPAPDFDVTVAVPSVADGLYVIYAVVTQADAGATLASSRAWNRTPFEVSASDTRGAWGDGGWGQRPAAATPAPAAVAVPAPAGEPESAPATAPATPAPEVSTNPAPVVATEARPPVTATRRPAPAVPGPATATPAPLAVPAPAAPADAAAATEAVAGEPQAGPEAAPASGSPTATRRAEAPARDGGPGLVVALAILAAVVAGAIGAFALSAPERQRATARAGRR